MWGGYDFDLPKQWYFSCAMEIGSWRNQGSSKFPWVHMCLFLALIISDFLVFIFHLYICVCLGTVSVYLCISQNVQFFNCCIPLSHFFLLWVCCKVYGSIVSEEPHTLFVSPEWLCNRDHSLVVILCKWSLVFSYIQTLRSVIWVAFICWFLWTWIWK